MLASIALIFLLVLCVLILCMVLFLWMTYNRLILLRNRMKEAWSDIEVLLKRRYDLIPNLVETVKGYAGHEKELLDKLAGLRSGNYSTMSDTQKLQTNSELSQILTRFMAVVENYPDLKANQNFMKLSDELSTIETDIANSRKYYNGTVRELNNFLELFPTNIIGFIFKFSKEKMFEITETERQNVKVSFND